MTTFTWSGIVSNHSVSLNNQSIFSNCSNRYYTYGAQKQQGCINPNAAGTKLASVAFNICTVINKCALVFVPPSNITDLTTFLRSGRGSNTFVGSQCVYSVNSTTNGTFAGTPTPTASLSGARAVRVCIALLALVFSLLM
jgi:hypothetical protein